VLQRTGSRGLAQAWNETTKRSANPRRAPAQENKHQRAKKRNHKLDRQAQCKDVMVQHLGDRNPTQDALGRLHSTEDDDLDQCEPESRPPNETAESFAGFHVV
jgi:hypothetical protein